MLYENPPAAGPDLMTDHIPVFDGHNDVLLRLYRSGRTDIEAQFLNGVAGGHIDLPRAQKGGLAGGMFAIFPPPIEKSGVPSAGNAYEEMPPALERADALSSTLAMASILFRLERQSGGAFAVCRKTQ